MPYDWEQGARDAIAKMEELLPENLCILGLVIGNAETAEGALVLDGIAPTETFGEAEIWNDVAASAGQQYELVRNAAFSGFKSKEVH